jgi:uncharacterized membrane protein
MKEFTRGALAGAAGTTALNAVGFADMTLRPPGQQRPGTGRGAAGHARRRHRSRQRCSTPEPAGRPRRACWHRNRRWSRRPCGPVAGRGAQAGAAGRPGRHRWLGVSDPRTWDAASWLSDIVPHLAFGAVVYAALPPGQAAAPPKVPSAAGSEESQAGGTARGPAGPGQVAPAEPASPATPAASVSRVLEQAAVLGAATGMRSTVALAALVFRRSDGLPAVLRHPAARRIAATADGAELVVDKLPGTPSRLNPPGLTGRLISASLAGAVLARSEHRGSIPSMLTASVAALAAAKICHDARAALARRLPDPVVAVAEDALAIGLAAIGSG